MTTDPSRLWQLISPSLPVGAYHHSQGLEQAVAKHWVDDEGTAREWIRGLLENVLAYVDLPILVRVHEAWRARDATGVAEWDRYCRACRETRELREEEANMGAALMRLAREMHEPLPALPLGYTAAFGVLAGNWRLTTTETLTGYAWSWCENQVLAAIKLIPLGHSQGQILLRDLGGSLAAVVAAGSACDDADIGRSAPGFALASTWHETQYSRLFRS